MQDIADSVSAIVLHGFLRTLLMNAGIPGVFFVCSSVRPPGGRQAHLLPLRGHSDALDQHPRRRHHDSELTLVDQEGEDMRTSRTLPKEYS